MWVIPHQTLLRNLDPVQKPEHMTWVRPLGMLRVWGVDSARSAMELSSMGVLWSHPR
jgi:hypothetical protein